MSLRLVLVILPRLTRFVSSLNHSISHHQIDCTCRKSVPWLSQIAKPKFCFSFLFFSWRVDFLPKYQLGCIPLPGSLHRSLFPTLYSASASSAVPSAFVFFLFLGFFFPVFLARGCSRIFRISSSVIFLSVWYLLRSSSGGPPSLVMPFLVMASVHTD